MKLVKFLILGAIFCLDVHVRAEEACWKGSGPCVVQAKEGKTSLAKDGLALTLDQGALLERLNSETLQLVNGSFYADVSTPVVFKTPYGRAWCEDNCRAIFERDLTDLTVKSLAGTWVIQRTGEKENYSLPVASQVKIGEVKADGRAEMDFPQSLPWTPTVHQWAHLFPEGENQFKPLVEAFRPVWKRAVDRLSDLQKQAAERTIASVEKSEAEARARRQAQEREDAALRKLFREKNP